MPKGTLAPLSHGFYMACRTRAHNKILQSPTPSPSCPLRGLALLAFSSSENAAWGIHTLRPYEVWLFWLF